MIRILADELQKVEILAKGIDLNSVTWTTDIASLVSMPADLYMDLKFFPDPARIASLKNLPHHKVVIHAVTETLTSLALPFTRINGWPGFLGRPFIECCFPAGTDQSIAFEILNWQYIVVPDAPGFIAARIIAMIINEAYLALEEGVSSKENIDLAMRTGTNYPFGPFEWGLKIGLKNICRLLTTLADSDSRYLPAALLLKEAAPEF